MPIVPLYGHAPLRARLLDALRRGVLPQSLLFHGETGIGKQRLALWLASVLVCEREDKPCGACPQCRMAGEIAHPDILWVFPRPRPKGSDESADDVKSDLIDASRARVQSHGLYAQPSGSDGIFVSTIHTVLRTAAVTPAMARRKVIIIGDAERMVSQEGSDQAANAFLKLLEEPLANTYLVLTTSIPGALLPTIRSRAIAVRVAPLAASDVEAWLADPAVQDALKGHQMPPSLPERVALAAGAPGRLLGAHESKTTFDLARRFVEVARSGDGERAAKLALSQGSAGARGAFSDLLDAIEAELRSHMEGAVAKGDVSAARGTSMAVESIEDAKALAYQNVNPQLITWSLVQGMSRAF